MPDSARPKVVVLGTMTTMAVAGVVWQYVHYLRGLADLGYDAWYVEDHAIWPTLSTSPEDDGSAATCAFLSSTLGRFDLGDKWAFRARHSDGSVYGLDAQELRVLFREAALIINMHGATVPEAEHSATGRLAYLDTDPGWLQTQAEDGAPWVGEMLAPHSFFFTFGENIGRSDCPLMSPAGYQFLPTRQPVVLSLWDRAGVPRTDTFTTIATWRQTARPIHWRGRDFLWTKDTEFEKVIEMPERSGRSLELAINAAEEGDRQHLMRHGWSVIDGYELSRSVEAYRDYIIGSIGEFTVAKQQYVEFRTGWFSDRSASYLGASRPVITPDTGLDGILPTGAGLVTYSSPDEAIDAVKRVSGDPTSHESAAGAIAKEFFDARVVLAALLGGVGLPSRARQLHPAVSPERPQSHPYADTGPVARAEDRT